MRIFVTGATGFIGSIIVQELLDAGHQVVGLARSDKSATLLASKGAEAHRGTLEDLESLKSGAADSDGVIHTAFHDVVEDFSKFAAAIETDRRAAQVMGEALMGSGKPLVITSGTLALTPGRVGTEEDGPDPKSPAGERGVTEDVVLAMASQGVRPSVVRLSPSVHGVGDRGFMALLINLAREKGVSAYVGEGANVWPAVHRLDAAHLFCLAVEKGTAGTRYHGAADEGVLMRDIAEVIGRQLNLPVVSKSPEEAPEHFGWLAGLISIDNPTSSALTRERLGWNPTQPGLIADLEQGHYFEK